MSSSDGRSRRGRIDYPFHAIPAWVNTDPQLDVLDRQILTQIIIHAPNGAGESFVSVEFVAGKCDSTRQTVHRRLRALVGSGLLEIEARTGRRSIYRWPSTLNPTCNAGDTPGQDHTCNAGDTGPSASQPVQNPTRSNHINGYVNPTCNTSNTPVQSDTCNPDVTGVCSQDYRGVFPALQGCNTSNTPVLDELNQKNLKRNTNSTAGARAPARDAGSARRQGIAADPAKTGDPGNLPIPGGPIRPQPRREGRATPQEEAEVYERARNYRPPRIPGGGYEPTPTEANTKTARLIAAYPGPAGDLSREWLDSWGIPRIGPNEEKSS